MKIVMNRSAKKKSILEALKTYGELDVYQVTMFAATAKRNAIYPLRELEKEKQICRKEQKSVNGKFERTKYVLPPIDSVEQMAKDIIAKLEVGACKSTGTGLRTTCGLCGQTFDICKCLDLP